MRDEMKGIRYSVIIPHYDDVESLALLLKSIPEREDIQKIVVDDNTYGDRSTFPRKLKELYDGEVELYKNPSSRHSAGSCMNVGLKYACGEWLLFADADDLFTEGAFDCFDRYADSDLDMILFTPTSVVLPEGKPGVRHISFEEIIDRYLKDPSEETELRYQFIAPWSRMVRRSVVEENGIRFKETLVGNDRLFSVKCGYYAKKIGASKEVVYCVTRKEGTLSSARNEKKRRAGIDAYISDYVFLKSVLDRKTFLKAIDWPGGRVIRALCEGYGLSMVRYILYRYRQNGVSLLDVDPASYIRRSARFVRTKLRDSKVRRV